MNNNLKKILLTSLIIIFANKLFSQSEIIKNIDEYNNLSNELRKIQKLDEAYNLAEKAKLMSVKINYQKGLAYSHKNIANVFLLSSNFEESIDHYLKSLNFKIQDSVLLSDCYNNLAVAYSSINQYQKALSYNFKYLKMIKNQKDTIKLSKAFTNIGNNYYRIGMKNNALHYYFKSLYLQYLSKDIGDISKTIVNIATIFSDLEYFSLSIFLNKISLNYAQKTNDIRFEAICLNNIGFGYYNRFEYSKSLNYLFKSIEIKEKLYDKKGILVSLGIIGSIYREKGNMSLSNQLFIDILTIAEEIDDKRQTAIALTNIGENLRILDNYDKAINYYHQSNNILFQLGATNEIKDNYQFIAIASYNKKEFAVAKEYYKKYKILNDSTSIKYIK